MSFSLNGIIITQTGTDTDLSGLTGISGVTTNVFNFTTEYILADRTLKIDGTCTQAPSEHLILTGPNAGGSDKRSMTISSGGTFIFGEAQTFTDDNSVSRTVYSGGQFLYFAKPTGPQSWLNDQAGLVVASGGAMEIYGGYIRQNQAINFESGSSLIMRKGRVAASSDTGFLNFYLRDATVDIIGFEYFCIEATPNAALGMLATYDTMEGYDPSNIDIPIGPIDSIPHGLVIVEKYAGGGKNPIDISFRNQVDDNDEYRMMEATIGNNLIVKGRGVSNDSRGWATHYIRWTPTFVNSVTKAALVDIQVYMIDTDSTDRLSPYSPGDQVIDLPTLADGQFSATTLDVLTGVWHNDSDVTLTTYVLDDRLPISGGAIGYLYNISVLSLLDSTVGEDSANIQMVLDVNITEQTKATVDAYTTIDDNAELYDRGKSHLLGEYAGEAVLVIEIDGIYTVPDGGIVIDPAAASAFAHVTFVTIKSSAFTGAIKTPATKTVLQKGTGGQIDYEVNGDLQIEDASVTWTVTKDITDIENLDAGNNLTVNVENGASVGTSEPGTGNGQVNLVVVAPIKVTVKDINTLALIQGARVHIRAGNGGDLPYQDSITITRSGSVATAVHTAHGMQTGETIYIQGANQGEYNGESVITVTTVNAYTFVVSGTPTTPATGTIIATASLVNDITDGSGEVNDTMRFTNDQPVAGTVRKATP
jgi:hypothetical protein